MRMARVTADARDAAVKEQGVGFGVVLTVLAVILTIGAVWFALSR